MIASCEIREGDVVTIDPLGRAHGESHCYCFPTPEEVDAARQLSFPEPWEVIRPYTQDEIAWMVFNSAQGWDDILTETLVDARDHCTRSIFRPSLAYHTLSSSAEYEAALLAWQLEGLPLFDRPES